MFFKRKSANNQRINIGISGFICSSLLLIICSGCSGQPKEEIATSEQPALTTYNNWQNYYTFAYPKNWEIQEIESWVSPLEVMVSTSTMTFAVSSYSNSFLTATPYPGWKPTIFSAATILTELKGSAPSIISQNADTLVLKLNNTYYQYNHWYHVPKNGVDVYFVVSATCLLKDYDTQRSSFPSDLESVLRSFKFIG